LPSKLYYFRARYYNPSLHRFISEDPLNGFNTQIYSLTFETIPSILLTRLEKRLSKIVQVARFRISLRRKMAL